MRKYVVLLPKVTDLGFFARQWCDVQNNVHAVWWNDIDPEYELYNEVN